MGEDWKFHLVNWNLIRNVSPISSRGLGIRKILIFNQGFIPISSRGLGKRKVLIFNQGFIGKWLRRYVRRIVLGER
jgi:hypothetical protein